MLSKAVRVIEAQGLHTELVQDIKQLPIVRGRLVLIGQGKYLHIASLASSTFSSLGVPSHALDSAHICHGDSGSILQRDLVLWLSKSGDLKPEMQCVWSACGAKQYLLTMNPNAKPAHECKAVQLPALSTTMSYVAYIAYLMLLADCCQLFDERTFLAHSPGGLQCTEFMML